MTNNTQVPSIFKGNTNQSINSVHALEKAWMQEGVIEAQKDQIAELEATVEQLREDNYDLRVKMTEMFNTMNSAEFEEEYADQGGLVNPF